jgi:hypothetical protein
VLYFFRTPARLLENTTDVVFPRREFVRLYRGTLSPLPHHKSTESMVSGGDPKRELVPPGRQQWAVGVLRHDEWSLNPGRLLLGTLSLGDTQDSSIGGFHHGGALVIWSPRRPRTSFGFFYFFEFLRRVNVIISSGLWQARRTYLRRSYVRLSSQRVLRSGEWRVTACNWSRQLQASWVSFVGLLFFVQLLMFDFLFSSSCHIENYVPATSKKRHNTSPTTAQVRRVQHFGVCSSLMWKFFLHN